MWMVRSGRQAGVADAFKQCGCVAPGWRTIGDLSTVTDRAILRTVLADARPDWAPGKLRVTAGQVARFRFDFQIGDTVVTYHSIRRVYVIGRITSDYAFDENRVVDHPHIRTVKWLGEVRRDDLTTRTKNHLGSLITIFAITSESADELMRRLDGGEPTNGRSAYDVDGDADIEQLRRDVVERAREFIKDRLLRLDWEEMQEVVAGVLRAMGYRTRISPRGPDRGRDITASPDGLGLEEPRIVVEVKHRKQQMGAPEIRRFLGGCQCKETALYVSTGGFTREACYEADRSNTPLTLVNLDDLVDLIVQYYESVDADARALIPLVRVYWPTS